MSKKKLFLLGGSPLQGDLLRNAKARYHVVVIDGNLHCSLRYESDEFIHLDFSDTKRLHEIALVEKPALILTMASELGNLSAAIVSAKLGLVYNSVEVVSATVNKVKMKQCLINSRIPTARYIAIMNSEESVSMRNGLEFPLIVKPSQSSAGRGVKLVNSNEELEHSVLQAKEISQDGCALVEEFIVGEQYSVETISCKGQHFIVGITREYFGELPYFAETQQMFPAELDSVTENILETCAFNTLAAFGIKYGACHIELRVDAKNNPYVIEIASRVGGWRSELIKKAFGVEYSELLLQSHENDQILFKQKKNNYCLVKMIFDQADLEREQELRGAENYSVSPITWLKNSANQERNSLINSAGYYFVEATTVKDAINAL